MGFFQFLRERKDQRRYIATLTIYLAAYTYTRLSVADQRRVSEWTRELIDGGFMPGFSYKELELFCRVKLKAAYWAVAMQALGIAPALPGEIWQFPARRARSCRKMGVTKLMLDWPMFREPSEQAVAYLASKGVDVSAIDLTAK